MDVAVISIPTSRTRYLDGRRGGRGRTSPFSRQRQKNTPASRRPTGMPGSADPLPFWPKSLIFALLPFSAWGVPQGACCTSWLLVVLTDWGAGLAAYQAGFYAHRPAEQECAVFTFHCAQDKLSPRCVGCGDWWVCVCLVGTLCILVTDAGV